MSPDLARRAWAAIGWSYGGALARALLQFVAQLALARLLGPEAFGQSAAVMSVLGIGWLFAEGGFGSALVQRPTLGPADVSYALGWVLLISGLTGAVVALGAPGLAALFGDERLVPMLRAAGLLVPLQAVSNIPASLMRRELDIKRGQLIHVAGYTLAYGGLGIALALAGAGAWSLIGAYTLHTTITLVASWQVVRHTLRPTLAGDPALRAFGLGVTGANLGNWAVENLDRIVISRFWGSVALGQYAVAASLSRVPVSYLVSSVQTVAFASASRLQDDRPRVARAYLAATSLVLLVACPLFALLACHAPAVLRLLYGPRWDGAAALFTAFCAAMPMFALQSVAGPLLWAVGGVGQELRGQVLGALLLVAGLWAMGALPLAGVVWFVTAIYGFRLLWVHVALAARLALPAARFASAARGGLLLGTAALLLSLGLKAMWPDDARLALWVSLLVAGAGAPLALRLGAQGLVGRELREILANRAGDSPFIAALCRFAKLERPA